MKLGICQEGNEEAFARMLLKARTDVKPKQFFYVEIGLAGADTMGGVIKFLDSEHINWHALGFDLADGWSLSMEGVMRNLGGSVQIFKRAPHYTDFRFEHAMVVLDNARKTLMVQSIPLITFALIDGCHGAPCAKADFIAIARHIAPMGIVAFHDATDSCQGGSPQPHCGTPIEVRKGLRELGLLDNKLPGWTFLEETSAQYGIVFVQFTGEQ